MGPGTMRDEPMIWEKVEWRQGDGRYAFVVEQGGLFATLSQPGGKSTTMPTVAWEALVDAIGAARKAKAREPRHLPARTGARWSQAEADELVAAYQAGSSIEHLAKSHNRSVYGIQNKLEVLGVLSKADRLTAIGHDKWSMGPSDPRTAVSIPSTRSSASNTWTSAQGASRSVQANKGSGTTATPTAPASGSCEPISGGGERSASRPMWSPPRTSHPGAHPSEALQVGAKARHGAALGGHSALPDTPRGLLTSGK